MKNFTRVVLAIILLVNLIVVKETSASTEVTSGKRLVKTSVWDFEKIKNKTNSKELENILQVPFLNQIGHVSLTDHHGLTIPNNTIYRNNLQAYKNNSLKSIIVSDVAITPTNLNLGSVEVGKSATGTIQFHNNSGKDVEVSVVSNNTIVHLSPSSFIVSSGVYVNVSITFDVFSEGYKSAQLTFNTSNQNYPHLYAYITATGYFPAHVQVSPDSYSLTLEHGQTINKDLFISNIGPGQLNYSVSFTYEHSSPVPPKKAGLYAGNPKYSSSKTSSKNFIKEKNSTLGNDLVSNKSVSSLINTISVPGVSLATGLVWVGNKMYIVNYGSYNLYYYDKTNGTTNYVAGLHSEPYGIAWDGTYLWIGNSNGTFYAYTLAGAYAGLSFQGPFNFYSSIYYKDGGFYISGLFQGQVYRVDYSGSVIWTKVIPNGLTGCQIIYVDAHTDGNFWIQPYNGTSIYQIKNDFSDIIKSVNNGFSSSNTYALAHDGQNLYSSQGSQVNVIDDGIDESQQWLHGADLSGFVQPNSQTRLVFTVDASSLSAGTYKGYLNIVTNDLANPTLVVPIDLTVTGDPKLSVSKSNIDFGNSLVNLSKSSVVTITNSGAKDLELSSFASSIPQLTSSIASTTIASGQSANLTVSFLPNATQSYSGLVSFNTNDPSNPSYTISVQGIGDGSKINFNVTDGFTGNTLTNASVVFNGESLGQGNYQKTGVYAGIYSYSISLTGYTTVNSNVNVDEINEVVNVVLNPISSIIVMSNGTVSSNCSNLFYDPGYTGNYANNQDMTLTITPADPNRTLKIDFQSFSLESGWDYLYIYNGPTTSDPLINTYSGSSLPPSIVGTSASGAITFRFTSDGSVVYPGWVASVTCLDPNALSPLKFSISDFNTSLPVSGATINVEGLGSGTTDLNGNYSFGMVAIGSYSYSVVKSGYFDKSGEVLYPGTTDVNLSINKWPTVTFNVNNETGSPISNATVTLGGYTQQTNGSGVATFSQIVPLKNYTWAVTMNGYTSISGEQYIGSSDMNFTYQLQPDLVDLSLYVLDAASNTPLKNSVVVVNGNRYITSGDGKIFFGSVPKGTYNVNVTRHAYYGFNSNVTVSSNEAKIYLNKIPSIQLPFSESFNSGMPSNFSVYDIQTTNYQVVWSTINTNYAGGTPSEAYADWRNGVSTVRLLLPPINTSGENLINLSFKHYFDDFSSGMKILVETSTDGDNWTSTGWEKNSGQGNYGPQTINIPISTNTNSSNTYIAFVLSGDLYQLDDWYIDDVQVYASGGLYNASFIITDIDNANALSNTQVSINGYGTLLTDNNGNVTFTGLQNGTYNYSVSKDGYEIYTGSLTINNNNASKLVSLTPNKSFTLTIVAYDQDTYYLLKNVLVNVEGLPAAMTNQNGDVSWSNVPVGDYNVTMSKEGYYNYTGSVSVSNTTVEFYPLAKKYYNATFTVVDINSQPIQNALVTIEGKSGLVTNEFGKVTISNLESSIYNFTIQKTGFDVYSDNVTISGIDKSVNVTLTETSPSFYSVLFNVKELDGTPIANADVWLSNYGSALTDINGEVVFTNIPLSTSLTYKIEKTDYNSFEGIIGLITEDKELDVVLKPVITLNYQVSFHVVDATGTALAGAQVDLESYGSAITNASGNVTFNNVQFVDQLEYQVTLATYKTVIGNVTVHGNVTTSVVMTLSASTTYSVNFHITNSGGSPVKDALVYLSGYGSLMTNSTGDAIFNLVSPKNGITYTVSKSPYANLTGSFNLVNTNITQNLILNTNVYRALFTVKDQYNNPYEGVSVNVLGYTSTYTNSYGTAIIGGLSPSTYSYLISTSGGTNLNGSFTITNDDLPVNVTYSKPEYPVTFTVKDESGNAINEATIELHGYGQKSTNTLGQAIFTGVLPANDMPFAISKSGYLSSEGLISVSNSSVEKQVTLILKRYSVNFEITSNGTVVPDAIVTFNGVANQAGNYLFTNVAPGAGYTYSVTRSGYNTFTGTIGVFDYTTVSVKLEVETFPVTFTVSIPTSKSGQTAIPAKIIVGGVSDTLTIGADWHAKINLPRGSYNFKVWATGYQTYYGTFEVVSSALDIVIRLETPLIIDNTSIAAIKAYPNPFIDLITLNNTSKVKQILVTNLIGQQLFFKKYDNDAVIQIETDKFVSGVYLIKLFGEDGSSNVIRMVKK